MIVQRVRKEVPHFGREEIVGYASMLEGEGSGAEVGILKIFVEFGANRRTGIIKTGRDPAERDQLVEVETMRVSTVMGERDCSLLRANGVTIRDIR